MVRVPTAKAALATLFRLDRRVLLGLMVFVAGFLLVEGWLLVLRKPYAEYLSLLSSRSSMASALREPAGQPAELDRLARQLKRVSERLNGTLRLPAADEQLAASLMLELDRSGTSHGVTLAGVKPKERRAVGVLEEISFEIGARGQYVQLGNWLLDFGNSLGRNATVTEVRLKRIAVEQQADQVDVALTVALYRPLKPVAK